MLHRLRSAAVVAVAVTLAAVPLAGCTSAGSDAAGSSEASSSVLPPVIAEIRDLDGATVSVPLTNVVDLNTGDEPVTGWTADIADSAVVEFIPGNEDGSAQFNPGLRPLEPGTTEVTLSNKETGDEVAFTVKVTEE